MRTICPQCSALVDASDPLPQRRQTIPCPSCGVALTRLNRDDWTYMPGVRFAYAAPEPAAVLAARAQSALLSEDERWLLDFLFDEHGNFLRDRREEAGETLGLSFEQRRALTMAALEKGQAGR